MKEIKIDLAAALELKRTVDSELENLTDEQQELIDNIYELNEGLKDLEFAKSVGLDTRAKEFEEKLKSFDGLLDKQYWNDEALFCIGLLILSNCAQTLEERLQFIKNLKNVKNRRYDFFAPSKFIEKIL